MLMENAIGLINLFIAPVISLFLYFKRGKKELRMSLETFCVYSVFLILNILLGKALLTLIKTATGFAIALNSSYYTVIASALALLLPLLYELVRTHLSVEIERKK